MTENMPDGKLEAINALNAALEQVPVNERISKTNVKRIIDIAWKHQFEPVIRAGVRTELLEVLSGEFDRAGRGNK